MTTRQTPMIQQDRIPSTLKAVFLASNRGQDIHTAPPERVAFKVFSRNWIFQRRGRMDKSVDVPAAIDLQPIKNVDVAFNPKKLTSKRPTISPLAYLDGMIRTRGYSTRRFMTLQTAYYNKPTALQQASYDVHMIELVKKQDAYRIGDALSAGLSPNPCNSFGESLVHMVCRRGDHEFLKVMLKHGCSVQVSDDYGRTPLHDACWAAKPAFEVVDLLLQQDVRLLHLQDFRGFVPLLYCRQEHWADWIDYFESRKDVFWPQRDGTHIQEPPPLTLEGPNTHPIPDPKGALTLQLAGMVASGRMKPEEAEFLRYEREDVLASTDYSDHVDISESDFSTSENISESYADETFNEEEMADILNSLGGLNFQSGKAVAW